MISPTNPLAARPKTPWLDRNRLVKARPRMPSIKLAMRKPTVTVTVGFLIASLIDGILGLAFTSLFRSSQGVFGRAASGFVGLIIGLIVSLVWGLIAGTLLSFLGSYLALD